MDICSAKEKLPIDVVVLRVVGKKKSRVSMFDDQGTIYKLQAATTDEIQNFVPIELSLIYSTSNSPDEWTCHCATGGHSFHLMFMDNKYF